MSKSNYLPDVQDRKILELLLSNQVQIFRKLLTLEGYLDLIAKKVGAHGENEAVINTDPIDSQINVLLLNSENTLKKLSEMIYSK